ncbi:hypothetical protein BDQ12DRAFT_677131 [Crucibulum laeve]|uniref:PhoD-like phosphatase domain-containing protein n=1 Tax=Crucibulum laeve TaxID=68775 RepID=A0A5C3MDY9_9AGAR|nr:hypothetical protein BDQ12DRAFT_677131 [Crucibulum laeve]
MDNPGWHAQRRAQKEQNLYLHAHRSHHGTYNPVEQIGPMDESFIGGFHNMPPPSPGPPALPPKDFPYPRHHNGSYFAPQTQSTVTITQLAGMSAVERSQTLRVARMEPHLQFMCGPLLKYDTVDEQGIWHGAVLVVTADSGSIYEPHPTLVYEWDPDKRSQPTQFQRSSSSHSNGQRTGASFDLGPHPADPHSTVMPASPQKSTFPSASSLFASPNVRQNGEAPGPNASRESVLGQEIWVYGGQGGTFTFWRFMIRIPLAEHEMAVTYSVNHGQKLEFFVPGRNQNMRWAAHSCNGFSAGVNPDDFRGPGYRSGYDPVWMDLLSKHTEKPFHVLVGGGDQLYCDSLMRESEMQEWVSKMKPEEKKSYQLSEEMELAIDRFFFNHYCQHFRSGAFARANSSIPMLNMCDDHDIIDGFGSYPDDMQMAPVFRAIGARGYHFFLLFQCFINPAVDGTQDLPGQHVYKSIVIGTPGPFIPLPSHSTLSYLGPHEWILMLDCRAERKKDQVCSPGEYQKVFQRLNALPRGVEHLIVQIGIPIAYPRMVFLEAALESKFNPLVALGRNGSMGLTGFVNKFNAEAELLDDLNDHWTARGHKRERNWFIEQLQNFSRAKRVRVSFVSGDVHCSAVGVLKTLKSKGKPEIPPSNDPRYMINVVTSAIVNTPPPNGVITMVSSLATKVHKTLHHIDTDETMLPVFETDTSGKPQKQKYIMGQRNWCQVDWDTQTGELVFDIRVEKEKGYGVTAGYPVRTPPPGWQAGAGLP